MRVSGYESALGVHLPRTGGSCKLHCECTSTPECGFSILQNTYRVNTNFLKTRHPPLTPAGGGRGSPLQTPYGQKNSPPYGRGVDRALPTVALHTGNVWSNHPCATRVPIGHSQRPVGAWEVYQEARYRLRCTNYRSQKRLLKKHPHPQVLFPVLLKQIPRLIHNCRTTRSVGRMDVARGNYHSAPLRLN